VAVVVLAPQVPEQLVLVEEPQFAVLTPWMSLVAFVVDIADTSVCRQLGSRVSAALSRENLEVFGANLAVEHLVDLSHVLLELVELDEGCVVASWAPETARTSENHFKIQRKLTDVRAADRTTSAAPSSQTRSDTSSRTIPTSTLYQD
jgi:hypothetical protein